MSAKAAASRRTRSVLCGDGRHVDLPGSVCRDQAGCGCDCHEQAAHRARLDVLADDPSGRRGAVRRWLVSELAGHLRDPAPVTGRPRMTRREVEAVVELVLALGWRPVWAPTARPDVSYVTAHLTAPPALPAPPAGASS